MSELISIIVPVYNTEAFLRDCVQSALRQSYSNFELILIDDGSQDGSAELCRQLCSEDPRIRFLPRPHKGVSAARNAGIDAATGEYLFFLDSDDTVHPFLLEALVRLCKSTGAALATEVYRHVKNEEIREQMDSRRGGENPTWEFTYMNNAEAFQQFSSRQNGYNFQGIGGKMIRRSAAGTLRFRVDMRNGEDTLFVYQLIEDGLDAVILWAEWYEYRLHPGGASRRLTVQYCEDTLRCARYICQREMERESSAGVEFWTLYISAHLRRLYVRSRRSRNREVSAYLKELARQETVSDRFSLLSSKEQMKHYLAFHCFPLYLPMHGLGTLQWRLRERKQKRARDKEDWNG